MSKKQVVAAAQNAVVGKAQVVENGKFKVPEEYKKVLYRDWPESLKKEYQAYRKAGYEKAQKALDEKWDRLLGMLDGDALALAKEIRNGAPKKKANPAQDLFGKEPEVGDRVLFSMDKLKLVEKCQAKGFKLDIETGKEGAEVVLKALPKEEAAA